MSHFFEMSRPQMSIITLYLVTIATHLLEFFSNHYRVNEEQFRSKIDLKNKQTNKQKRRTFSVEGGGKEGGGRLPYLSPILSVCSS